MVPRVPVVVGLAALGGVSLAQPAPAPGGPAAAPLSPAPQRQERLPGWAPRPPPVAPRRPSPSSATARGTSTAQKGKVHVSVVTKGLERPWAMVWLPGGDILVTERPGRLRVIRKGVLDPKPISGLPRSTARASAG